MEAAGDEKPEPEPDRLHVEYDIQRFLTLRMEETEVADDVIASENISDWTVYHYNDTNATRMYTRRAYIDERSTLDHEWTVRIYAVITPPINSGRKQFYCCLLTLSAVECDVVRAHLHIRAMKELTFDGRVIARAFITCRVPENSSYTHVVPMRTPMLQLSLNVDPLPLRRLHDNESAPLPHQLGVCVPLSYGFFDDADAVRFIEWIETHVMFGVSEFNIYNVTMLATPAFHATLQFYQNRGWLRVIDAPPPLHDLSINPESDLYNVSKMADLVILNECLAENMYRYRHVIVIDLDEVMVPRTREVPGNYRIASCLRSMGPSLLEAASLIVQSFMYFLDVRSAKIVKRRISANGNVQRIDYPLIAAKHTIRLSREEAFLDAKQITNPRVCTHAYLHHCDRMFSRDPHDTPVYNIGFVSENRLVVQHYRSSCRTGWRKNVAQEQAMFHNRCHFFNRALHRHTRHLEDRFMERFLDDLWPRVLDVRLKLGLNGTLASPSRYLRVGGDLRFNLTGPKAPQVTPIEPRSKPLEGGGLDFML